MDFRAQKVQSDQKNKLDGTRQREAQKLSLRKKRMNNKNQTERMEEFASKFNVRHYSAEDSYEINLNYLTVTPSIQAELKGKTNKIDQIAFLVNYLPSSNIFDKKYAVKNIERILFGLNSKSFEEVKPIVNSDFVSKILTMILAEGQDKQIIYECSKIICYIIFYDENYASFVIQACPHILRKVRDEKDTAVQGQLLWIICQVMEGNKDCYDQVMKICEDLPGFVFKIVSDINSNLSQIYQVQDLLPNVFWIYAIMLSFSEKNYAFLLNKAFQDIPVISKFLKTRINFQLFSRALDVTVKFANLVSNAIYEENKELTKNINFDQLFNLIANCGITQSLLNNLEIWDTADEDLYKTKESKENTLKALCHLTSIEDEISTMMDGDIVDSMVTCLKKYEQNNYKIKRYVVLFDLYKDLLENSPRRFYERLVKKSEILKIAVAKYFNGTLNDKEIIKKLVELLYIILCDREPMKDFAITSLICIKAPELLFDQLKEFKNYEEIEIIHILDSICSFIEYSWQFDSSSKTNCMVELAKREGIKEVFDNIAASDQVAKTVSEYVEKILDKYFKDNDI